jgi:hypothetical protein
MKSVCAISGDTFKEKLQFTKKVLADLNRFKFEKEKDMLTRIYQKRFAIKHTMGLFDVDHIDGNHYNNNPDNLQTLTKEAHKLKTMLCGDFRNNR